MTIIFTDEELEYIDKEPFNWHPKKDCPKKIEGSIKRKLKLLKDHSEENKNKYRRRT